MLDSLKRDWQAELPIYSQDRFVPLSRSGRSHTPLSHYVLYFVRKEKINPFAFFFFSVFCRCWSWTKSSSIRGRRKKEIQTDGMTRRLGLAYCWYQTFAVYTHTHTDRVERERESWMMLEMVDWAGYNIAVVIISSVSVLSSCVRDRSAIIDSEREREREALVYSSKWLESIQMRFQVVSYKGEHSETERYASSSFNGIWENSTSKAA